MTVGSDRTDNGRPVPYTDDVTARIPVQPRPTPGRHQAPTMCPPAPTGPAGPPPAGWGPGPQQMAPPQQTVVAPHKGRDVWPIFAGVLSTVVALALVVGAVAADAGSDTTPTPSAVPAAAAPTSAPADSAAPVPETTTAPIPPAPVAPKSYTGKGDDVIAIEKPASVAIMTFSCPKCTSNTVVKSDGGEGLLVNEIGSYTGTVPMSAPALIQITSDGDWSITPQ